MKPTIDKKAKSSVNSGPLTKSYNKAEILSRISATIGVSKEKVSQVMQELETIIEEHIEKGFDFSIPGLLKICVVHKSATPERKGINPLTKKVAIFKAKPAHKVVRVKALKKLKSMGLKPAV